MAGPVGGMLGLGTPLAEVPRVSLIGCIMISWPAGLRAGQTHGTSESPENMGSRGAKRRETTAAAGRSRREAIGRPQAALIHQNPPVGTLADMRTGRTPTKPSIPACVRFLGSENFLRAADGRQAGERREEDNLLKIQILIRNWTAVRLGGRCSTACSGSEVATRLPRARGEKEAARFQVGVGRDDQRHSSSHPQEHRCCLAPPANCRGPRIKFATPSSVG